MKKQIILVNITSEFKVSKQAIAGSEELPGAKLEIFFANGGFALQGNVFNKETLIKAQENPEKYSTLQVRVCGWNEYFVKMSKEKQDLFIKQCEV